MRAQHDDRRGRRALYWSGGALLLCLCAFLVPQSWLDRVQAIIGEEPSATAFDDQVAQADGVLETEPGELAGDEAQRVAPLVLARRLTRAGPMTAEEMEHAADIWREATINANNEPPEGSRDAHFGRAQRRLLSEFPRLDQEKARREIEAFRAQLRNATGEPGGTNGPAGTCATCHAKTMPLPDDRRFDVLGVYPFVGTADVFAEGRRFPVLVEALELEAARERDSSLTDATCLSCHRPHEAPGFGVSMQDRIDNMGLWINEFDTHPDLVHIEVKVKNEGAGHRAPAGAPAAAYVVTVSARQDAELLAQRSGRRLPRHLRNDRYQAGLVFGRRLVDSNGAVTTSLAEVHDLTHDTRLMSGRFSQRQFSFDRRTRGDASIEVVLWYLPDVTTWDGAQAVRRATR